VNADAHSAARRCPGKWSSDARGANTRLSFPRTAASACAAAVRTFGRNDSGTSSSGAVCACPPWSSGNWTRHLMRPRRTPRAAAAGRTRTRPIGRRGRDDSGWLGRLLVPSGA
jgi:hypothetical protein